MAMSPIADHVNENIRIKFLAIMCCYLCASHDSFGVIPVDMKYGSLDRGSQRCTIIGTPCIIKVCGKPNLVIDNKMNGSAGIIPLQFAHLHYFVNNSLAGK